MKSTYNYIKILKQFEQPEWVDKTNEYAKRYYHKHKEELKLKRKERGYFRYREYQKEWYQKKKEERANDEEYQKKRRAHINKYVKNRLKKDIQFKLRTLLRIRINTALKNRKKTGSAIKNLGCSVEKLKEHLEKQFKEGMRWDNHGKWHIDHIQPLSNFDLTDKEQFSQACHFSNLQPLWAQDNFIKSNKIICNQ